MATLPDYFDPHSQLARHWDRTLAEFAAPQSPPIDPVLAERHTIHAGLLAAIVDSWWNGNSRGARDSDYPMRAAQRREDGSYLGDRLGDRYLGHNIAAIAVDASGRVRDLDFNHNALYDSSVQHAEARLVRRLFDLDGLDARDGATGDDGRRRTSLDGITIFTSLESCAQCAGIMALARLPQVFYLQPDPGQYLVAQLLHRLSDTPVALHLPASAFGFPAFDQLTTAYASFRQSLAKGAFFWRSTTEPSHMDRTPAVTSFLCTDAAREIYRQAASDFAGMTCRFPDARPGRAGESTPSPGEAGDDGSRCDVLSNAEVLSDARRFLDYATRSARRGTPHFN